MVPTKQLLRMNRFDIAAKYLFASDAGMWQSLYEDHIRSFNGGVEAHVYVDQPMKRNVGDFVAGFNRLYQSLKEDGWMAGEGIPVSRDLIPLDGGHRIGIAIALGIESVEVCKCDWTPAHYDYLYFRGRGLHPDHLEAMRKCWINLTGDEIPQARRDPFHLPRRAIWTRLLRARHIAQLRIMCGRKF